MSAPLIIAIIVILVFILLYNSLVAKKNQVENVFATIDTQLKKRYDLIPNLVSSVSQYMKHEKSILEDITKLRAKASNPNISQKEKIALDSQVSSALGSIMVAVENYPELKANENIMQLQYTLTEVEEQISAARRAYNQAVTDYNNALEQIPTNILANMMGYSKKDVFVITKEERKNIDVGKLFNS